jgi:site-specific DNA-cytosine methylase
MINGLVLFKKTGATEYALRELIKPTVVGDEIDIIHGSLPTEAEYARIVRRELGEEQRNKRDSDLDRPSADRSDENGSVRRASGNLYEQIYELAKEIQPKFLFFEIRRSLFKQGFRGFLQQIIELGYDCRWDTLSAYDVGSPQKRERVYLLARLGKQNSETVLAGKRERTNADVQFKERLVAVNHSEYGNNRTVKRTPERVAEVEAGLDEVCVPQYREAFLRLVGLKEC